MASPDRRRPRALPATVDLSISRDALGFKFQGEADETPALVRTAVVRNRGCSDLDRSRDITAGVLYPVAFSPSRYCGCGGIGRQRTHSRSKQGGRFPSAAWNHRADHIPEARQQEGSELLPQLARARPQWPNIALL